jgi:hypothetical protein
MRNVSTGTTYKIKPDFEVETKLALQWYQLSNGNYRAVDRGYLVDDYKASIRFYGTETTINDIIEEIEDNRVNGGNVLRFDQINYGEHIWGADINYSGTISCTAIFENNRRGQKSWRGWDQTVKLALLSPQFIGGSGYLPPLRFLNVGVDADANRTINKQESYLSEYTYADHNSDKGKFTGTFTFDDSEMIALRRYVATQRGSTITINDIPGIINPWGRRTISYPITCKVIDFQDHGVYSYTLGKPRWKATLTLAEDL